MITEVRTLEAHRPLTQNIRVLSDYRELLFNWTAREIKSRYRQSVLGAGWAVIQPLIQMAVISTIFGGLLRVPSDGVPYPVFAFAALAPWTMFSQSITAAVPSLRGNMDLVTKVYFPREILPISAILARLIDFGAAFLVFLGMLLWYGMPAQGTMILLPLLLLIQITLAAGLSLWGAAVGVFVRDVSFAVPLGLQIWMYMSPVIYPLSMVPPKWRPIYLLNPMAGIIDAYRNVMLAGVWPNWTSLAYAAAASLLLFVTAYIYFKRVEMAMSDII